VNKDVEFSIEYLAEAQDELDKLDGSVRIVVLKAIDKVSKNPLPESEGGYGKALGNTRVANLAGLLRIKLKSNGIRIIYQLERVDKRMKIVIIGMRSDDAVYRMAQKRREKYGL
jgi:mRNA interferase RelE/StbE